MWYRHTMAYYSATKRMASIKKKTHTNTNTGEDVERKEPPYTVGGNVI